MSAVNTAIEAELQNINRKTELETEHGKCSMLGRLHRVFALNACLRDDIAEIITNISFHVYY